LSTLEISALGAAGAFIWLLVVHGLPLFWSLVRNEVQWTKGRRIQPFLGVGGLVLIYSILGAVASNLGGAQGWKEAIAFGLGWQGIFGHFVKPPAGGD